jgi:WD40 repeat protein
VLCVVIDFLCLNATFSNISAISWRPVLVVEEARVPDGTYAIAGANNGNVFIWNIAKGKVERILKEHK